MATALDRWDEEGGAQELAWPLPYEASDLRDVERRVLECLGAALVSEWNDLPTDRAGPGCLDSAPLDLSGFLPGYAERGALRFCRCVGRA
ncbi:hypothetical protein ACVI1J_002479 [Bradyrhizobium diazoefficiens]